MKRLLILVAVATLCATTNAWSQNDDGIVIDGVTWAASNVGAPGTFVAKAEYYGDYYSRYEANGVCPEGWRLPTKDEFERLIRAGSRWTTSNGVAGRAFGDGDDTVFFPAGGGEIALGEWLGRRGYYWSSTHRQENTGYTLGFDHKGVYVNKRTFTFPYYTVFPASTRLRIRCVRR